MCYMKCVLDIEDTTVLLFQGIAAIVVEWSKALHVSVDVVGLKPR